MFSTVLKYAIRNIFRSRMRSLFTLISIVLTITLYTVLTSIGNSFTAQISKLLEQQSIDIAVQAKYAPSTVSSKISYEIIQEIKKNKHVIRSESMLISRKRVSDDVSAFILGLSNYTVFARRLGFRIIEGRELNPQKKEVVIGARMSKILKLGAGDKISFNKNEEFQIVGVSSSWLSFLNSGILIDLNNAQRITGKKNQSSLLFLTLDDTTKTNKVIEEINAKFPEMRAITSLEFPDHIGPIKSIFYFSRIVSVLTLFIVVAVLLNTFIMAISERTKEIGILSAIGWQRYLIISVFLCESLILSFAGGIMGYFLAFPTMMALQLNLTNVFMYFPDSPDIYVFFKVLVMCFSVGILSTLFPALYGTKIQIATAFHHE